MRTMKPFLALVFAAFSSVVPAQDRGTDAGDLPRLREAFEAASVCEWGALIAVVQGHEPVILVTGAEAAGKEVTPQTLVPLLVLAKVLAADAIHVQLGGKTDQGAGVTFGGHELSVRELLDGVTLLPNVFVLDGGEDLVDVALLRRCGELAAGAKMELSANALGAAEFVLLEPLALGGRDKDWPSMLRATLAPRVPGLDPVGADALGERLRGNTILAAEELAKCAAARPALFRTMLSLQNLGTWLQWRAKAEMPLWTSARMGRAASSLTRPQEPRWVTGAQALGVSMTLAQYPARQAALLWIHPPPETTAAHQLTPSLQRAFEADLLAAGEESVAGRSAQERFQAAAAAARANPRTGTSLPSALAGTRWVSATVEGETPVRLAFGRSAAEPVVLTVGDDTLSFSMSAMGDGLRATPTRPRPGVLFQLWLRPEPAAQEPTRITGVLITQRLSGTGTAALPPACASVARYFEWQPAKE